VKYYKRSEDRTFNPPSPPTSGYGGSLYEKLALFHIKKKLAVIWWTRLHGGCLPPDSIFLNSPKWEGL